jgi:hypothetical protein
VYDVAAPADAGVSYSVQVLIGFGPERCCHAAKAPGSRANCTRNEVRTGYGRTTEGRAAPLSLDAGDDASCGFGRARSQRRNAHGCVDHPRR